MQNEFSVELVIIDVFSGLWLPTAVSYLSGRVGLTVRAAEMWDIYWSSDDSNTSDSERIAF